MPSSSGRGSGNQLPASGSRLQRPGTQVNRTEASRVTSTASGTRVQAQSRTSATTIAPRGPATTAGRTAGAGRPGTAAAAGPRAVAPMTQRPSTVSSASGTSGSKTSSVTRVRLSGTSSGTSGVQTTKVKVSGAGRGQPGPSGSRAPTKAPSGRGAAKPGGKVCKAQCSTDKKEAPVQLDIPDVSFSDEIPPGRHVPPGRYYYPAVAAASNDANSPAKLKQKLQKYTPQALSHWKIEVNDPFAKDIPTLKKAHPDIRAGVFQVPYKSSTEEEMEEIERTMNRDFLEETMDPSLPEADWSMSLREAMSLQQGEYEDEDEDGSAEFFDVENTVIERTVEAKLPPGAAGTIEIESSSPSRREEQAAISDGSPKRSPSPRRKPADGSASPPRDRPALATPPSPRGSPKRSPSPKAVCPAASPAPCNADDSPRLSPKSSPAQSPRASPISKSPDSPRRPVGARRSPPPSPKQEKAVAVRETTPRRSPRPQSPPRGEVIQYPETHRVVESREVTPPKMQSPVGPVEAKQEFRVERQAQVSPQGAVLDTRLIGTRVVSPGVAQQIEIIKQDKLPPGMTPSQIPQSGTGSASRLPAPSTRTSAKRGLRPPSKLGIAKYRTKEAPTEIKRPGSPMQAQQRQQPSPPRTPVRPGSAEQTSPRAAVLSDSRPQSAKSARSAQVEYGPCPRPAQYRSPLPQYGPQPRPGQYTSPPPQYGPQPRLAQYESPAPQYGPQPRPAQYASPLPQYGPQTRPAQYKSPAPQYGPEPRPAQYASALPQYGPQTRPAQYESPRPQYGPQTRPAQYESPLPQYGPQLRPAQYASPLPQYGPQTRPANYESPRPQFGPQPRPAQYESPRPQYGPQPRPAQYASPLAQYGPQPRPAQYESPRPQYGPAPRPAQYASPLPQYGPQQRPAQYESPLPQYGPQTRPAQYESPGMQYGPPPRPAQYSSPQYASPARATMSPRQAPWSPALAEYGSPSPPKYTSPTRSVSSPAYSPATHTRSPVPQQLPHKGPSPQPMQQPYYPAQQQAQPYQLPYPASPRAMMPPARGEPMSPARTPPSIPGKPRTPTSPKSPLRLDISVSVPPSPCAATLTTLRKLVEEEQEDAKACQMAGSPLRDKIERFKKKPQSMRLLEETLDQSIPVEDDGDTMKSDMMASMMDSEEKGLISPTKSPKRTYESLFPPLSDEPTVQVSPAAPAPLQDIVVPFGEATADSSAVVCEDLTNAPSGEVPRGDVYAETMKRMRDDEKGSKKRDKTPQKDSPRERADKKKSSEKEKENDIYIPSGVLDEQRAPWDIADMGSLEDLVGGRMSVLSGGESLPSDESIRATAGRMEYILEYEKPKHYSCVQLRGSQTPHWFPGYYSVFPHNPNYVRLERSPSGALAAAWNVFAPQAVRDTSEVVIL